VDENYPLVVQVKATADATPQNFRPAFDLGNSGGCKLKELVSSPSWISLSRCTSLEP
jgi:hypothetical protein